MAPQGSRASPRQPSLVGLSAATFVHGVRSFAAVKRLTPRFANACYQARDEQPRAKRGGPR